MSLRILRLQQQRLLLFRALSDTNKSAIDTTSFGSVPTVFVSATVTLGTAAIAYVTPASSRFIANQPVVFSTSTVTNIVAGTTYYVISTGLVSTGISDFCINWWNSNNTYWWNRRDICCQSRWSKRIKQRSYCI